MSSYSINLKKDLNKTVMYHFLLDDEYFSSLNQSEISKGSLKADIAVKNGTTYTELWCTIKGEVSIPCDRCLDDMTQPIDTENYLKIVPGDEANVNESEDEILYVPAGENMLDLAWCMYECIDLSIPIKHTHAAGQCNKETMAILQNHITGLAEEGDTQSTE